MKQVVCLENQNLKRLNRRELLELLVEQNRQLDQVREQLAAAEQKLQERELVVKETGSLAEASLKLNGVFDAAQAACRQYEENICRISRETEQRCARQEFETEQRCAERLQETEAHCAAQLRETQERCSRMVAEAKQESEIYWEQVLSKTMQKGGGSSHEST